MIFLKRLTGVMPPVRFYCIKWLSFELKRKIRRAISTHWYDSELNDVFHLSFNTAALSNTLRQTCHLFYFDSYFHFNLHFQGSVLFKFNREGCFKTLWSGCFGQIEIFPVTPPPKKSPTLFSVSHWEKMCPKSPFLNIFRIILPFSWSLKEKYALYEREVPVIWSDVL